nr:HupE/UreJ family protein [Cyclobacteriaceae bacterium]
FSNYLQAILGKNRNIASPLFAFNVGLEVGQLIIVAIFLVISFILVDLFTIDRRDWKLVLSSVIAGMALVLMKETYPW